MKSAQLDFLIHALRALVDDEDLTEQFAAVLAKACSRTSISYDSVISMVKEDAQELMLEAWGLKLLIPRRSSSCGEWDYRIPVMRPGEIYEMPNIGRYLVKGAMNSGKWDPGKAAADMYRDMGEEQWEQMPALIRQLDKQARGLVISAAGIDAACRNSGFYHKTGPLILILKGGGIISPKLASGISAAKRRSPVYELNPSLYPYKREDA